MYRYASSYSNAAQGALLCTTTTSASKSNNKHTNKNNSQATTYSSTGQNKHNSRNCCPNNNDTASSIPWDERTENLDENQYCNQYHLNDNDSTRHDNEYHPNSTIISMKQDTTTNNNNDNKKDDDGDNVTTEEEEEPGIIRPNPSRDFTGRAATYASMAPPPSFLTPSNHNNNHNNVKNNEDHNNAVLNGWSHENGSNNNNGGGSIASMTDYDGDSYNFGGNMTLDTISLNNINNNNNNNKKTTNNKREARQLGQQNAFWSQLEVLSDEDDTPLKKPQAAAAGDANIQWNNNNSASSSARAAAAIGAAGGGAAVLTNWKDSDKVQPSRRSRAAAAAIAKEEEEDYASKLADFFDDTASAVCFYPTQLAQTIELNFLHYCEDHATAAATAASTAAERSGRGSIAGAHHKEDEQTVIEVECDGSVAVMDHHTTITPAAVPILIASPILLQQQSPHDEAEADEVMSRASSAWSAGEKNMYLFAMAKKAQAEAAIGKGSAAASRKHQVIVEEEGSNRIDDAPNRNRNDEDEEEEGDITLNPTKEDEEQPTAAAAAVHEKQRFVPIPASPSEFLLRPQQQPHCSKSNDAAAAAEGHHHPSSAFRSRNAAGNDVVLLRPKAVSMAVLKGAAPSYDAAAAAAVSSDGDGGREDAATPRVVNGRAAAAGVAIGISAAAVGLSSSQGQVQSISSKGGSPSADGNTADASSSSSSSSPNGSSDDVSKNGDGGVTVDVNSVRAKESAKKINNNNNNNNRAIPRGAVTAGGTAAAVHGVSGLKDWRKPPPASDASVASSASTKSKRKGLLGFKKKSKKWHELESDDDCYDDAPLPPIPMGTVSAALPDDDDKDDVAGVNAEENEIDDFVEEIEKSASVAGKAATADKKSDFKTPMERQLEMLAHSPSDESAHHRAVYAADDCSLSTYYTSNTLNSTASQWSVAGRERYLKAMAANENMKQNVGWVESMHTAASNSGYSWDAERGWVDLPTGGSRDKSDAQSVEASVVFDDAATDARSVATVKDDQSIQTAALSVSHLSPSIKSLIHQKRRSKRRLKVTFAPGPIDVQTEKCSDNDKSLFSDESVARRDSPLPNIVDNIDDDEPLTFEGEIKNDRKASNSRSRAVAQFERSKKRSSKENNLTDEDEDVQFARASPISSVPAQVSKKIVQGGSSEDVSVQSLPADHDVSVEKDVGLVVSRTNDLISRLEGKSVIKEVPKFNAGISKKVDFQQSLSARSSSEDFSFALSRSVSEEKSAYSREQSVLTAPSSANATQGSSVRSLGTGSKVAEVKSVSSSNRSSKSINSTTQEAVRPSESTGRSIQSKTTKSSVKDMTGSIKGSKPNNVVKKRTEKIEIEFDKKTIRASQKSRRDDGSLSSFDASTVSTKFTQHPHGAKKKNHPKVIIELPNHIQPPQSHVQSSPVSNVARKSSPANIARKNFDSAREPPPRINFTSSNKPVPPLRADKSKQKTASFSGEEESDKKESFLDRMKCGSSNDEPGLAMAHLQFMMNSAPNDSSTEDAKQSNGPVWMNLAQCNGGISPIKEETSADASDMSLSTEETPPPPVPNAESSNMQKNKLKSYMPAIPHLISEESLDTNVGGSRASSAISGSPSHGTSSAKMDAFKQKMAENVAAEEGAGRSSGKEIPQRIEKPTIDTRNLQMRRSPTSSPTDLSTMRSSPTLSRSNSGSHASRASSPSWQALMAKRTAASKLSEKDLAQRKAEANAAAKVEAMMSAMPGDESTQRMAEKRSVQKKRLSEIMASKRHASRDDADLKNAEQQAARAVEKMMSLMNSGELDKGQR